MAKSFPQHYKFCLTYRGTLFKGLQIQPNPEHQTIQGEIQKALKTILGHSPFRTLFSGRTDAGVHALNQYGKIETESALPPQAITVGLNRHLPQDIRIKWVEACHENFHPIKDAQEKEYWYFFVNQKYLNNPFFHGLISSGPKELHLTLMQKACALFEGEHDFCNFYNTGTEVSTTVRTITHMSLSLLKESETPSPFLELFPPHCTFVKVRGTGFLKQMVRSLVGHLWAVGEQKISLDDLKQALSSPKRGQKLAKVAPPDGLYLSDVFYPKLKSDR